MLKKLLFFLKYFLGIFSYQKKLILEIIKKDKAFSLFLLLNFIKVILITYVIIFMLDKRDNRYLSKNTEISIYFCLTSFFLIINFWSFLYNHKKIFIALYIFQILFYFVSLSFISANYNYVTIINYLAIWKEGFLLLQRAAVPIDKSMLILFIDLIPLVIFIKKKINQQVSFIQIKKCFFFILFFISFTIATMLIDLYFFQINIESISYQDQNILLRKKRRRFIAMNGFIGYNVFFIPYSLFNRSYIKDTDPVLSNHAREVIHKNKSPLKVTNNFIYIQIESLPSGIFEEKYNGKLIMPFLNQLTKQENTLYVKYMLNYHGAGNSFDSTISVINNIEPLLTVAQHSLGKNYKINNSIVPVFKKQGYKAYSFQDLYAWFFSAGEVLNKMQFDYHFSNEEISLPEYKNQFLSRDEFIFDFMADRIRKKNGIPFFYFAITLSTHSPFTVVQKVYTNENYSSLYQNDEKNLGNFLTSLSYTDKELKRFLSTVYKEAPNTYVVIYGDHTIRDTQYPKPALNKEGHHLEFVPLIVVAPKNIKINKKINSTAFSHDIAATVLPLSKISYQYRLRGYNILDKNFDKTPIHFYNLKLDRKKTFEEIENVMQQKKEKFRK